MNDHSSPLSQRVRRLLGSGPLQADPSPLPTTAEHTLQDTGALFESHISRLSSALRELRAIDRQREAELRTLREQLATVEARQRITTARQLEPLLQRMDALVAEAAHLLQQPPEPPPTATLFERMRARAAAREPDAAPRAALLAWAATLMELRAELAALAQE